MAVRGTKDYLAGVDKMMFVKSHFVTSPDGVCFKRIEFETFNHGVGLLAKNWRSQFATSNYQKTSRSQFATLKTGMDYHFLDFTKMIGCSRNFRPQNRS
jgi:hypothetical protein